MRKFMIAAAVAAVISTPVAAAQFIGVLTGGTSGVYYPLGVALTKIFGAGIKDAKPTVQATKASVENLNLLQQGRGELAFALGDSVTLAWKGDKEAGFPNKLDKLRGIASLYPNFIQIVASEASGIKTLADLKGKRLSVGAPKSGTELNARAVLKAAGMSYSDLKKVEFLGFGESVELMKNRQLDATLQSAGLGVSSIRDLATSIPIVVVSIPDDVVTKVGDAAYISVKIPAGTYEGQKSDVETAAVINVLVTHSGVNEEIAYQMTKLLFTNLGELTAAHAAAKDIKLENALRSMPIPLHAGAARYFKEAGITK